MSRWFTEAFGNAVDEIRHELLGGWFGRNFEPHPARQQDREHAEPDRGERDIHGNERGIDR